MGGITMKHRNVFGELEFELGAFFVPHRTGCTGQYCILKHEPWYVTDAVFADNIWERTPLFDSWIQAVRFLKKKLQGLAIKQVLFFTNFVDYRISHHHH